jgi:N4-gp56 family major capsid protein
MANAYTLTANTTLAGLCGIFYDKLLLESLNPELKWYQFADKKSLPKGNGKTVYFTQMLPWARGASLTEGTNPSVLAVSARLVSVALEQFGSVRGYSDVFELTALSPALTEIITQCGQAAGDTLDKEFAYKFGLSGNGSNLSTFKSGTYASAGGISVKTTGAFPWLNNVTPLWGQTNQQLTNAAFSAQLNVSQVLTATTHLRTLNVKPMADGNYIGIIHPGAADVLMRTDGQWAAWNQYTNAELMYAGEIGRIQGVRFVSTTNAINEALVASDWSVARLATGGVLYGTMIFGKGAYGCVECGGNAIEKYINQGASKTDPLNQETQVGYKITTAIKELNPSCGVIIGTYVAA